MIIKQGYTDPKILPDPIIEKIGNHMTFNMTVKDKSIVVNKATDATNGDTTPTDPHTITTPPKALMLPPPTPNPKATTTKRALQHSPGNFTSKTNINTHQVGISIVQNS
ncbi:hypothetical protein Hanom_Chr04g00363311 [Helianthus anomalus]